MNPMPISGTTGTENAPPLVTAAPYNSSHDPGNQPRAPRATNATVSTAPATSAGVNARANRRVVGAASGTADRRTLTIVAARPIAAAMAASTIQTVTQRGET